MHDCICDEGTFMTKAHTNIHQNGRWSVVEESSLTPACILKCGSSIIADDDMDRHVQ